MLFLKNHIAIIRLTRVLSTYCNFCSSDIPKVGSFVVFFSLSTHSVTPARDPRLLENFFRIAAAGSTSDPSEIRSREPRLRIAYSVISSSKSLLEALRRGFINQEFLIDSMSCFGWSFNFLEISTNADKWSWLMMDPQPTFVHLWGGRYSYLCLHGRDFLVSRSGVSGETGRDLTMSRQEPLLKT